MERLLTIRQVSHALRVSPTYVYQRLRSGEWPGYRFGRLRRIAESDVVKILEANQLQSSMQHAAPRRVVCDIGDSVQAPRKRGPNVPPAIIEAIRKEYVPRVRGYRAVAKVFGLPVGTVAKILRGDRRGEG